MADTAPNSDLVPVQAALDSFLSSRASLVMGTRGEQGQVELSVAPFLCEQGVFYVLLSGLAPHTGNLHRERSAEILLLEDEADGRQAFARIRASLSCIAEPIDQNAAAGQVALEKMEAAFGGIVALLRSLPDFQLFGLTPREGRYIAGFGRAYRLSGLSVVEHLRG